MTAIELKMSLLQETVADDYVEPTKEEILAGLRNALQDVMDLRAGKDVSHKFMDAREWLKTLD